MINFALQDIDKDGNHCALVASYRKSCTRCKLIACSCLRLPSPLRHSLEVSTSGSGPNTIASCALDSLLLELWTSKLYSTWAGFEITGTSSSLGLSMLFHPSTQAVPPSLLHTPNPPFLLLMFATVSRLASLLTSTSLRYYSRLGNNLPAWSSIPGQPALALALGPLLAVVLLLSMTCLGRLRPCVYCY